MSYNECIANSNLAFGGNQFDVALNYAKEAITLEPKEIEGYFCAGKACMSMENTLDAVKYFEKAVDIDDKNGGGYFLLGYANAMAGNTSEALKALTKAIESGCEEELKGQIYRIMAMINSEQSKFEDALVNIEQAQQFLDVDYELLQQKAACYAELKDYRNTLFTLNQMKLIQPTEYMAYSLAFHIFMELGIYDEAKDELERAKNYAELNMSYYDDCVAYQLLNNAQNDAPEDVPERLNKTLSAISTALQKGKPNATEVFEMYLRAAQLYLSLENPDNALKCLSAAENPVMSYNNDFSVLMNDNTDNYLSMDSEMKILSPEEEEEKMQEKWDNGEFDDISDKIQEVMDEIEDGTPEEITEKVQKYLSPLEQVPAKEQANEIKYKIEDTFNENSIQTDMKNALYLTAYELKKDYNAMLEKARELQSSDITGNRYSGIYYELKVGKYLNDDNWKKKYKDRINYWTKKMLEDPTDFVSASYRVRSYIDLEDFESAQQLCSCMPADVKKTLMEEINKAKSERSGEHGDTSQ